MNAPDANALAVHADFLRRLARGLLDSPDLVDDAVQVTLTVAWTKGRTDRLRGWLAGTLRNVARNVRRAESRRQRHLRRLAERGASSPEEIRHREATRQRLIEAVLALPDPVRDAVLLRYDEGLPPRDVAARLGCSVDTVHNRVRRGLALLRGRLRDAEGGDGTRARAALAGLAAHLPTGTGIALLGGVVMSKMVATGLAAAVLVAGAWWALRSDSESPAEPRRSASAPALTAEAETVSGPSLRGGDVGGRAEGEPRAEGAVLHGRVLDARTRGPVPGARVTALGYEDLQRRAVTADGDGRFHLPGTEGRDGAFHLVVESPGYARHVDPAARASQAPRTVLLHRGGSLRGRLAAAGDESPVPRYAIVAVRRPADAEASERFAAMAAIPDDLAHEARVEVTDADGRFALEELSAGTYALVFLVEGRAPWFWSGGGRPHERKGFLVEEGGSGDVGTVLLPRQGRIVVRVRDATTQRPLAGVTFEAAAVVDRREVRVPISPSSLDAEGGYVLPLHFDERGQVTGAHLFVHCVGYGTATASFVGQGEREPIDVELGAAAEVRGVVRDAAGTPRPGLLVVVREGTYEDVRGLAVTGRDGAYVVGDLAPSAALALMVFDRSSDRLETTVPFRLSPGETRRIDVGGAAATGVAGRLSVDGRPVGDALVFLDLPNDRMRISTDVEGRFRFEGLPAGRFSLFLNAQASFEVFLSRDVDVAEGRVTDVVADVSRTIRGTVSARNLDGSPARVEDLDVIAVDPSRPDAWVAEARVADDGTFALRVPGAGTYELSLGIDFFLPEGPVTVDLTRAELVEGILLSATADPADGDVVIGVTDAVTGERVPDARYEFRGPATSGSGSARGQEGIQMIGHRLRLGSYRFLVSSPVHAPARVDVTVTLAARRVETSVVLHRSDAVEIVDLEGLSRAGDDGLRAGDLILRHGETYVPTVDALLGAVAATSPAERVRLVIVRGGVERTLVVPGGRLGVAVRNARRADPR